MTCCDEIKFNFSVDIIDEERRIYDVTFIVLKSTQSSAFRLTSFIIHERIKDLNLV